MALPLRFMCTLTNSPYLFYSLNWSTILDQYLLDIWLAPVLRWRLTAFQHSHKHSSSMVLHFILSSSSWFFSWSQHRAPRPLHHLLLLHLGTSTIPDHSGQDGRTVILCTQTDCLCKCMIMNRLTQIESTGSYTLSVLIGHSAEHVLASSPAQPSPALGVPKRHNGYPW